ncbi:MAG: glucosylceramidase [Armatimonadetes bacterium]|nr:glucosylceramidase [Armatimonadota bacterium]
MLRWDALLWLTLAGLLLLLPASRAKAAGEIRFDFEDGTMQGWEVMDGKFEKLACDRATYHNEPAVPYNKQGRYFLSTLERADGGVNDPQTGVIESPVFVLQGPLITFLVGGGSQDGTYVALCTEDGREEQQARGGNTEVMQQAGWYLPGLVGKKVYISIVDRSTGPWGHVTFDDFKASGQIDSEATAALRKTFRQREDARLGRERAEAMESAKKRQERKEALLNDAALMERGQPRLYAGDNLSAIRFTVGGIGTGSVQTDGQGRRPVWQIFNNLTQAYIPHSFFATRVKTCGEAPVARALQTAPEGPFEGMKALTFRGEYPFAWHSFEEPAIPVSLSMETFNPLIPMNAKDSGIPCAVTNLTAKNESDRPVEVSFLAAQQNAVGYAEGNAVQGRSFPLYGGNTNRIIRDRGAVILHMNRQGAPGDGDMALMTSGRGAAGSASWGSLESLASDFQADGKLSGPEQAGPSPAHETVDGALTVSFSLKPGEKRTVTFVLAWYFPDGVHGGDIKGWNGQGNMYMNWWPDALSVARDVKSRLNALTRQTRLFHDSLYASNLPYWLLDRIGSQVAILRSQTCYWARDGYFGAWEGCNEGSGCCAGNCSHVWHYAQAHARLFPEIGRKMREQELHHRTPEGGIPHRQPDQFPACDGQTGSILEAYREHLLSPDGQWLARHWPGIRQAMDYTIATWDKDADGVMSGPQWNTLDASLSGSSSWLGSLYLAALAASERMAILQGEKETALRYRRIRESGAKKQNETLFNGEYYFQLSGEPLERDYLTGCHIDQALGQWWADQLDLGRIYPEGRVKTALRSLFDSNFRADFHGIVQAPRKFVDDDDAGMQMITWPKGGRPEPDHTMLYADEVMTGFEYSAAAAMVYAGLLREAFTVVKAVSDRYDGRLRTRVTGVWGHSGNPYGDDECGKFYGRAMSIWSLLLACQGFAYNGPEGMIGFNPSWKPENHASFFSTAEGWGLFSQSRAGGKQTETIAVRYGKLSVKKMRFRLPESARPASVIVRVKGQPAASRFEAVGGELLITINRPATLKAGQEIAVEIAS